MTDTTPEPIVLPRSEHNISRKNIDPDALKVLYRLSRNGFKAFLVGGCVRDLLLGRTPKDFDVATDATPDEVKALFRNGFLIGRRFRLAHIRFGRHKVIEVATFRRKPEEEELPEDDSDHFGYVENVFGTPDTDASRRDFTINALFYDIDTFAVLDYTGGLEDLEQRRLRVIGEPAVRFTEDPVRMLRCLEFCARLDFSMEERVRDAIYMQAPLIAEAAPPRIREEVMELFRHRVGAPVLRNAQAHRLLAPLLAGYEGGEETFAVLEQLDERTAGGRKIKESEVLAALFVERFRRICSPEKGYAIPDAIRMAGQLITPHCNYFHIAHDTRHHARELLIGFFRLIRGRGRRGEKRFLEHPATPDVLEFFGLWSRATGEGQELFESWSEVIRDMPPQEQESRPTAPKKRRRGRRRPRRPPPQEKG